MDLHGFDNYGHLFQYPDFHYLSSFGIHSDSPTGMLSMENLRFYNEDVWTLDANKSELTKFDFSLSGDSLLREETVALDEAVLGYLILRCLMILHLLFLTIRGIVVCAW